MSNVLPFKKPGPPALRNITTTVIVGDDAYTVRRCVEADGRGFMTIIDPEDGRQALVLNARITDDELQTILICYRAGVQRGYHKGLAAEDAL